MVTGMKSCLHGQEVGGESAQESTKAVVGKVSEKKQAGQEHGTGYGQTARRRQHLASC